MRCIWMWRARILFKTAVILLSFRQYLDVTSTWRPELFKDIQFLLVSIFSLVEFISTLLRIERDIDQIRFLSLRKISATVFVG